MTEKQKFFRLFSLVCEDLAGGIVDELVRRGHAASSSQLNAVRHGRQINLPWLIDLVGEALPHFVVPAELLPAPPRPVATAPALDL